MPGLQQPHLCIPLRTSLLQEYAEAMAPDLIRTTYDRRARWYDAIVRLLSFGGDREYRRRAVAALRLQPGQRVLDVGCGTGLNFRLLSEGVGPSGLVVGT